MPLNPTSHCQLVNPSDVKQIEGAWHILPKSLPAIAGNEGVAQVEHVGDAVDQVQKGDWVVPLRVGLGMCSQDESTAVLFSDL